MRFVKLEVVLYDYQLSFIFKITKKCSKACIINCLILKRFRARIPFKSCYTGRFSQQSAPKIPPSSECWSIDHYKIFNLAFPLVCESVFTPRMLLRIGTWIRYRKIRDDTDFPQRSASQIANPSILVHFHACPSDHSCIIGA